MADDEKALESQRATVREHVDKYNRYDEEAKNMALRTIRNAQQHIEKILRDHPHWSRSWEDSWAPRS